MELVKTNSCKSGRQKMVDQFLVDDDFNVPDTKMMCNESLRERAR